MKILAGEELRTLSYHPVELLQNLIRFNTSNPPGNELECIKYIEHKLRIAGISSMLIARDPGRPNLIARLPGRGDTSPLLLYGHIDVVPAENQVWQYPPFEGKVINNQIWGRGALDMKGGVAMMLSAFLRAKLEKLDLSGDVIFAVLSDEEMLGEYGAKYLVEHHPELFKDVRYAIGEFGGFALYFGNRKFYPIMVLEKQICGILAHIHGPTGHTTLPVRGGTMAKLGRILQKLDENLFPVHVTGVTREMLRTISGALAFPTGYLLSLLLNPRLTNRVQKILGPQGQILDPLLRNTVNPMLVQGGEHLGQVPREAILQMACILLPGMNPQDMMNELKPFVGEEVDMEVTHYEPAAAEPDMRKFGVLTGILREADPGAIPVPMLLPAPTDGHNFSRLGIQTYGFLPMNLPPDFDFWKLLHAPDERIPIDSLTFGAEAIYKLLQRFGYS